MLMTQHFDYCPSASEGDNQSVRSSAPVVSRCFPRGYNVKLYIFRGRLAWWLLAFLHSVRDSWCWKMLVFAVPLFFLQLYEPWHFSSGRKLLYKACCSLPRSPNQPTKRGSGKPCDERPESVEEETPCGDETCKTCVIDGVPYAINDIIEYIHCNKTW